MHRMFLQAIVLLACLWLPLAAQARCALSTQTPAARAQWTAGLAQIDLDTLLTDMNFWRLVTSSLYNVSDIAKRSETMVQFRDNLLEVLFQRQHHWQAAYSESVATAADVEALLSRLKGEEVKAEETDEEEEEEEEEDDNAWYDEEEEDEAEVIPEF